MSVLINDRGLGASESELRGLEGILGTTLPWDYRMWLQDFDGGRPDPSHIQIVGHPDGLVRVQVLFGLNRRVQSSRIRWNVENLPGFAERVLVLEGECRGEILFREYMVHDEWFVAESFHRFLEALYPASPHV